MDISFKEGNKREYLTGKLSQLLGK